MNKPIGYLRWDWMERGKFVMPRIADDDTIIEPGRVVFYIPYYINELGGFEDINDLKNRIRKALRAKFRSIGIPIYAASDWVSFDVYYTPHNPNAVNVEWLQYTIHPISYEEVGGIEQWEMSFLMKCLKKEKD